MLAWAGLQVVLLGWTAAAGFEIRLAAIAAGLAALVAYVYGYRILTGRDMWRPRDSLRWYDVVLTGIVPAAAAGFRFGSPIAAAQGFLLHLQGVAVIYAVVGFGLIWILIWSVGWLASQMPAVVALAARTLPLVLILVIFLLFTNELWHAARRATPFEIGAVIVLAVLIALGLLGTRVREDVRTLAASDPREPDLGDTPAASLTGTATIAERQPPLSRLQRWNIGLVLLVSQSLQALLVAALVVLFLLAVGLLLAPAEIQEAWSAGPITVVLTFVAFNETRTLSYELLAVSTILGTFAGVYFAGFALDDDRYRMGAVGRTLADLRLALAVRATYLAALAERDASTSERSASG